MIVKTEGIVFRVTHYSESSVIAHIFTRKLGLQSYLINGVRKSKSKFPLSTLQPLHLLEMVVYHKANGSLQRVSELKHFPAFNTIPFDIYKTSMVLFLNEILSKTIQQDAVDEPLFDFLYHSLLWLDIKEMVSFDFHLVFLIKLTHYLGFAPSFDKDTTAVCFDLMEGKYLNSRPLHVHYLEIEQALLFEQLFDIDFEKLDCISLGNVKRKIILRKILDYYFLHVNNVQKIKSLEVLEQLFS